MRSRFASSMLAALIGGTTLVTAMSASADTIVQPVSFNFLYGYGGEVGDYLNGFDPTQGTLESVTLGTDVWADFSGGGDQDVNKVEYDIFIDANIFILHVATIGNGSGYGVEATPTSFTVTDPDALASFIGPGRSIPAVTVSVCGLSGSTDCSPGRATLLSIFFPDQTLTYTYTPSGLSASSPVSEPASVALFGTALAGLALLGSIKNRGAPVAEQGDKLAG